MMKLFVFAIVAALAFQASLGKPAEQLSNLSQNAKKLADEISSTLGLQDLNSEKVLKTINDQSKAVAENLQNIVDKLKAEVTAHQPEIENAVKKVEEKLAKTADDLKKSLDPKTQKQIEATRQKFDDGVKAAATELDDFAKSIQENKQIQEAQANVKNIAKSVLDTFLETIKNAETQLKKTLDDHQKTHQN